MANSTTNPTNNLINQLLIDPMSVTDEEETYLSSILCLRYGRRKFQQSDDSIPSTIIDNFLYHGDFVHACDMKLLKRLDIRHILNICDCQLDKEIQQNFSILWINIKDDLHTDIAQHFDKTNEFLLSCKEKNEKVLIHCQAGISRSSSIVLAYLIKYYHETLIDAYDHLLKRRSLAMPNYSFFIQLIRYEKRLRASKAMNDKSSKSAV